MSATTEPPRWKDAATLRRLYIEQDLERATVADRLGCSKSALDDQLSRYGIVKSGSRPHQDADTLRRLYEEEGLTAGEIADRFDVAQQTVSHWMRKHEIEAFRRREYDNAELMEHLRDVHAECPFRVTQSDLTDVEGPSPRPYKDRWDSWTDALEAAGIDPDAPTREPTNRETLDSEQGTLLSDHRDMAMTLYHAPEPFRIDQADLTRHEIIRLKDAGILSHAGTRRVANPSVDSRSKVWEWSVAEGVRAWIRKQFQTGGTCPAEDCDATGIRNRAGVDGYKCTSDTCDRTLTRAEAERIVR